MKKILKEIKYQMWDGMSKPFRIGFYAVTAFILVMLLWGHAIYLLLGI